MAKSKYKQVAKKSESHSNSFLNRNLFRIIIFCFSFLLYINTIPNDYNLDDELVTRNHKLTSRGIQSIPEIFTSPYYSDNMGYAFEYRPMVHVSFAIEHQLFGESPHTSHFINALLYSCMCLLLFAVLTLLFREENIFLPLLITLLFTAHPVHTEVVASIKNRDEMLALFFSLASWYIILKYSEKKFMLSIIAGTVLFLAALLSKISIFSFVIIIPLSLLFFYGFSLQRTMVILMILFIPTFFIINILDTEFKLLLFAVIVAVLYLAYVFKLWSERMRKERNLQFLYFINWKSFLWQDVFPFNHRLFFPGLYLITLLLLTCAVYIFLKSDHYLSMIVFSGLCLLLSLKTEGVFKWLLLAAFQISLSLAQYLINDHFSFVIFLYCCFLAISFTKSKEKKGKLLFGSLLAISISLYFGINVGTDAVYFYALLISLIPFVFSRVGKFSKWIFVFLLVAELGVEWPNSIRNQGGLPPVLGPVYLVYLLLSYYPQKFPVKNSWIFALVIFIFFLLSITTKADYPNLHRIDNFKARYIKMDNPIPQGDLQLSGQSAIKTSNESLSSRMTLLPKMVSGNVNRPLDFVENPIMFKDPLPVKIASAFDVMLRYLKRLVIPYPLSYYYGYKVIEPVKLSDLVVVASILIHLFLLLLALYFFSQYNLIPLFAILIYFISILQFTNIFQAVPGMMADRYLLGPSLGFCMLAAYLLISLLKLEKLSIVSQMTKSSRYVIISLLLLYSGLTIARNRDWKDTLTLFRNDIKHIDQSAQGHNLLGLHLMARASGLDNDKVQQKQLREEALIHFKRAIEIYPEFFNVAYDLGRDYLQLNVQDSALIYFQLALSLDSTFSEIPIHMGEIYFYQGRYTDAISYFEQAVREQPDLYKGYDKLSYVYYTIKEFDKSVEVNRLANRKMPTLIDPLVNIGRTFMAMNQSDSAKVYFEKALSLDPNNIGIRQLLQQMVVK